MFPCDRYNELISAAIDGALSPAETETLKAHLAQCPQCRALYEELSALHAALADLPPVDPPADLTDRILAAVAAEQVLPFPPAEKKKAPLRWQKWLASAAVLAVVLLGTWSWKPWEHRADNSLAPAAKMAQVPQMADVVTDSEPEAAPKEKIEAAHQSEDARLDGTEAPLLASAPPAQTPAETGPVPRMAYTATSEPEEPNFKIAAGENQDTGSANALSQSPVLSSQAVQAEGSSLEESAIEAEAPEMDAAEAPEEVPSPALRTFQAPVRAPIPAPETEEAPQEEALPPQSLTPRQALDALLEAYPAPEDAQIIDTEDRLGWETPLVPVEGSAQQSSTRLEYLGLTANGKYQEFWLHSFLVDDPETGLAHSSTLNFFAVPLEGGEILTQRQEPEEGPMDEAALEAYEAGIQAYLQATTE